MGCCAAGIVPGNLLNIFATKSQVFDLDELAIFQMEKEYQAILQKQEEFQKRMSEIEKEDLPVLTEIEEKKRQIEKSQDPNKKEWLDLELQKSELQVIKKSFLSVTCFLSHSNITDSSFFFQMTNLARNGEIETRIGARKRN